MSIYWVPGPGLSTFPVLSHFIFTTTPWWLLSNKTQNIPWVSDSLILISSPGLQVQVLKRYTILPTEYWILQVLVLQFFRPYNIWKIWRGHHRRLISLARYFSLFLCSILNGKVKNWNKILSWMHMHDNSKDVLQFIIKYFKKEVNEWGQRAKNHVGMLANAEVPSN